MNLRPKLMLAFICLIVIPMIGLGISLFPTFRDVAREKM